jgi:predicted dinucleotide-binding enzyme
MTDRITIFGYGPVGRATAARLMAEGREVTVAQRRAPPDLPKGATFAPSDALDRDTVVKAVGDTGSS